MERKESANGLELIKFGCIKLKGHFSALFMGAFAMVFPMALILIVPAIVAMFTDINWLMTIGIVLFAIFIGPLQVGFIKYFNQTLDGKQPKLNVVFSQIKFNMFTIRTIYIATLLMLMYILGGILWMVPAGFAISFFSPILFFLEKYNYPKLRQAFKETATQMVGNRLAMFSYKLIFYFVYLLLFGIIALCLALVYVLLETNSIIAILVAICTVIVFIFMYTMITLYFHSCNQVFFEDSLMYHERKKEKVRKEKEQKALHKAEIELVQKSETKNANERNVGNSLTTQAEQTIENSANEKSKKVKTKTKPQKSLETKEKNYKQSSKSSQGKTKKRKATKE